MLTSGLFTALAVHAARQDKTPAMVFHLWATLISGIIFIWIKYAEFSHHIQGGLLWPGLFGAPGFTDSRISLYFGSWFLLSGTQALHVLAGLFTLSKLIFRAMRYEFSGEGRAVIESFGVFWQMGVLFWMVIFALLYLI
jgi:heme/copper-type cytochrome/quinol oxidase subunit 3